MTNSPHCSWCPTQPDTPEHLLLHCPDHHSHPAFQPHRPTLTDLLGSSTNPTQAFKTQPHQDLLTKNKPAPLHII
ncbi:hypothetical protein E2C01_071672 [Portunus trituberculatus]|uniref:Uncharacterized protein n=1 Tax=Portunus trituberculatus TaxID=210409 RepID=A0A5B7I517_PORTR|nr:hypothetical protein [Portunus trituberculatus]